MAISIQGVQHVFNYTLQCNIIEQNKDLKNQSKGSSSLKKNKAKPKTARPQSKLKNREYPKIQRSEQKNCA